MLPRRPGYEPLLAGATQQWSFRVSPGKHPNAAKNVRLGRKRRPRTSIPVVATAASISLPFLLMVSSPQPRPIVWPVARSSVKPSPTARERRLRRWMRAACSTKSTGSPAWIDDAYLDKQISAVEYWLRRVERARELPVY